MNEMNNEKYLNDCAEALASYLNCDKEEINIEEEEDYLIHSTYELNGDFYKITPAENIVEYIKHDLVPNKIYEIEMELKQRGLYDYIGDLDTYTIEEEIFDNLEEHFDSYNDRIPFDYNKQTYTIFKL
jgi:hypothetical protein